MRIIGFQCERYHKMEMNVNVYRVTRETDLFAESRLSNVLRIIETLVHGNWMMRIDSNMMYRRMIFLFAY